RASVIIGCSQSPMLRGNARVESRGKSHFLATDRMIVTERKSLPVIRKEDAPHIRMTGEADTKQVPHLALIPIGHPIDGGHAWHFRLRRIRDLDLESEP